MTRLLPVNQLLQQINMPVQDLPQLSFCDGSREHSVKGWVRSLPVTQIQFVSSLLYQALPEVARYQTSAANRIFILEALRQPTLQAIEGLAQGFLNQPLILPEPAVKTATIAQALQKHMINGYLVALRDLCKEASSNPPPQLTLALHRAMTGLGLLLMRYYQLYVPISGQLWTELHCLYQLALQLGISEDTLVDAYPHHENCYTITRAYTRILLLACARPNQLRQDEILATYNALDALGELAILQDAITASHDNLFAVALNSNRPPLYRSRFKPDESGSLLELSTAPVCKKLSELGMASGPETAEGSSLRNELNLTAALTAHLIQAWNLLAQRHFDRQQTEGTLDVTVGLTNIHYHMAGKVDFTHFLNRTHSEQTLESANSIFQRRGAQLKAVDKKSADDPWSDAFEISGTALAGRPKSTGSIESAIRQQEAQELTEHHPVYHVPLIDSSPGGYCIEWQDSIPNQVKAGELLGLREPVRNRWSLGVVRWVNQTKGATQLGIQVLAPQVTPVGLAMIHKTGSSSEYLRALAIPPLKVINQPATLITNAVSFREYSKARIYMRDDAQGSGKDRNIQLTRRIFGTGVCSQFTFRELATAKAKTEQSDDFDSVWD